MNFLSVVRVCLASSGEKVSDMKFDLVSPSKSCQISDRYLVFSASLRARSTSAPSYIKKTINDKCYSRGNFESTLRIYQ